MARHSAWCLHTDSLVHAAHCEKWLPEAHRRGQHSTDTWRGKWWTQVYKLSVFVSRVYASPPLLPLQGAFPE